MHVFTVQRLLPRENTQPILALLLAKVESVVQVLMKLTSRGIVTVPDMYTVNSLEDGHHWHWPQPSVLKRCPAFRETT